MVCDPDVNHKCPVDLVYNLSSLCVEDDDWLNYPAEVQEEKCNCFPLDRTISMVAGIWCVVNAVTGTSGNLLTLLAIPMAKKNNR